jgi:hypothetical protein
MIDQDSKATTAEVALLAAITPSRLSQLERAGVVKRSGRDQWLLAETLNKLFADARSRNEATSSARQRFEEARAAREELKLAESRRKLHDAAVAEATELTLEAINMVVADLEALPVKFTRDIPERKRLRSDIEAIRRKWAARLRAKAGEKPGKAA